MTELTEKAKAHLKAQQLGIHATLRKVRLQVDALAVGLDVGFTDPLDATTGPYSLGEGILDDFVHNLQSLAHCVQMYEHSLRTLQTLNAPIPVKTLLEEGKELSKEIEKDIREMRRDYNG